MSNLHRSLANAQLCPRVPLSVKHATIQTFYPVCYLKNLNLVTTDSSCLQSCQFTLLYSIFEIASVEATISSYNPQVATFLL